MVVDDRLPAEGLRGNLFTALFDMSPDGAMGYARIRGPLLSSSRNVAIRRESQFRPIYRLRSMMRWSHGERLDKPVRVWVFPIASLSVSSSMVT